MEQVVPSLERPEILEDISEIDTESNKDLPIDNVKDLLTDNVKQEQIQLEEKAREEEEQEYKKKKEIWMKMDEETKEMRYKKLEILLEKSSMFAQYILHRMEEQKVEEKKRREKWLQKLAGETPIKELSQEKINPFPKEYLVLMSLSEKAWENIETKEENVNNQFTSPVNMEQVVPSLERPEILEDISEIDTESNKDLPIDNVKDLLTDNVKQEQIQLEEKAREEEEQEYKKKKEIWMKMDEETKEMRYKKLEILLEKSSMFAQYILHRMEEQKVEEKKRREKWLQKLAGETPIKELSQEKNSQTDTNKHVNTARKLLPAPVPRSGRSVPNSPAVSENQSAPTTPTMYKDDDQNSEDSCSSQTSEKENEVGNVKRQTRASKHSPLLSILGTRNGAKKRKSIKDIKDTEISQPSPKKQKIDENESASTETEEKKNEQSKANTTVVPLDHRHPDIAEDGTVLRPAYFTGGELRPYQVDGLNWLTVLYLNGVNGILADEMGLGKTIQCIALITQIVTLGAQGPFMIVAPLSTLPNWKAEFKKFAPMLPVIFYHGKKEDREKIRNSIKKYHKIADDLRICPIVITSFEVAMIDKKHLQQHTWTYIIVDEGQRIKNKDCRLIRELRTYKVDHRLLLTGTPLQNNMRELWSLLNFLIPEIFDDLGSFESWFDVELISDEDADEVIVQEEQKNNILGMLHKILTPFMLRRLKTDVDLCIPPKKELLVYAPLTKDQEEFYASTVDRTILEKIAAKNEPEEVIELGPKGRPQRSASKKKVDYKLMMESALDIETKRNKKKYEEDLEDWVSAIVENSKPIKGVQKSKMSQISVRLQNVMMQLRKCCNHPYLLEYPLNPDGNFKVDEDVIKKSGKMLILDKMIPELKKNGHKILLFSQMTKMLDVLEDYCIHRELTYRRLDGSCSVEDRQESIEAFNTDPEVFIFLLSTRAGGLGLNLMAADTVIIYDSDWNPQNDLQAQDRCHRIGQTRPVMVYRFVTANTIDQRIVERASAKRKLEKMIILKGKFKSGIKNMKNNNDKALSPEELLELLKSKDHHGCYQKDNEIISKKDLAELLDRSDIIAEFERNKSGGKSSDENIPKSPRKESSSKLFDVVDYDSGTYQTGKSTAAKV